VAITVRATKLTAQALAKILEAALRKIQNDQAKKALEPQGRQSVKKLTSRFDTQNMPLTDGIKLFDQVIKEKNLKVDYAFMKAGGKNLLLFKAAQADEITAAFAEYTSRVMSKAKGKQAPILDQLKQAGELVRAQPQQRERSREAVRDER
jgi:hypothetical protein